MPPETVLITGASAGIGRELARLFAADKSRLVLVARRRERLEALADELRREQGIEVRTLPLDLSERAAPAALVDQLTAEGLAVDVLVNNAGFGALGPVAELGVARQVEMIELNVAALTHLTRLLLPGMLQRKCGGVLNVGSTAAFQPGPTMAVYFATKAYVVSFSQALAEELRGTGVKVSCLAPGPTATEFGGDSGMGRTLLFRLGTMDARRVARAGHRGLRRGRVLVIPGLRNWLTAELSRLSPLGVSRKITRLLLR
jgi:hypothetical protein